MLAKNREQKKLYQEISLEMSNLAKDESIMQSTDLARNISDAFSGFNKLTASEISMRNK